MAAPRQIPAHPPQQAEFERAFALLEQLVDLSQADQVCPLRGNAVDLNSVVLWMLVHQRMNPDSSLEAAVKRFLETPPALLPENRRVTSKTLSTNTGAYSRARQRLPREASFWLAHEVSQSLINASPPTFGDRRVFVVDGTTLTLAPEEELQQRYPPASNQYGSGVWPVALLVVAHELASGAALVPALGAMYGPDAVSETALMKDCLEQMPADAIVMADAGYGIFAVAWDVEQAGRSFVLRLSPQRFRALKKSATQSESGGGWTTSSLSWRPSPKDRQAHPDLPPAAELPVRLHQITLDETQGDLFLVTSLPHGSLELSELSRARGNVEIDLRNLKVVLGTEQIRARTPEMFEKELLGSLVAYNLVTQFRRQAAQELGQPPRRLSFKRTWTTFRTFLWTKDMSDAPTWEERYRRALSYAMQDVLPNRPGRSYPRETYRRRPKSTHFAKRQKRTDTRSDP